MFRSEYTRFHLAHSGVLIHSQPICCPAPTFDDDPDKIIMPNRNALVANFQARGLLAGQDRRTFTHAQLDDGGDADLLVNLESLQKDVEDAKVSMGLTAPGTPHFHRATASPRTAKAKQEEEDRKMAEIMQAEERGEYTTGPSIKLPIPDDFKRRVEPPRSIFNMNRSTGGRPPQTHIRAQQQFAAKFHSLRAMFPGPTASQPKVR